jgi:hypothetical protein
MSESICPAPWHVERTASGFRIIDATGRPLCDVHGYEQEVAQRASALDLAQARKIADGIALLPQLIEFAIAARNP